MRINSNVPKTFSIFVRKGETAGYLRLISSAEDEDRITYRTTVVKNVRDSSRFVNFDNAKEKAMKYAIKYNFDEVNVFDNKLQKTYHVKKESKK